MSLHVDPEYMRAFQFREENGYLPDDVYVPGPEDDPHDPEQQEIIALTIERYDVTNRKRREERQRARIATLENLLTEHGIEIPEEI